MVSEFPTSFLVLRLRPLACWLSISTQPSDWIPNTVYAEAMSRVNGHGNEWKWSASRISA